METGEDPFTLFRVVSPQDVGGVGVTDTSAICGKITLVGAVE